MHPGYDNGAFDDGAFDGVPFALPIWEQGGSRNRWSWGGGGGGGGLIG